MAEGLTVQSFFFSYTGRSLLLSILGFLILPFVWSLPESLITAELSTALHGNGGFVLWTHRAFGPFPGSLIGTWKFLSGAINSATYPALSADYVARNIPSISSGTPRAIAVSATTILLSFLNYTMPTVLQFFHSSCGASEASTNQFRDIDRAIVQSSRSGNCRLYPNQEPPSTATALYSYRRLGAILVDNLEITNLTIILNAVESGEAVALLAEFKLSISEYLKKLVFSPVRSLSDVIAFNENHSVEEKTNEFGQAIFLGAQNTSGVGEAEKAAIRRMAQLSVDGLERLMDEKRLDAVVFPDSEASPVFAIGGYPGITVPAGYNTEGIPFGIGFAGLRGSETKLIEVAYAFEQATRVRRPPKDGKIVISKQY